MQYCTEMGISKFGLTAYAHFGARFVWVRWGAFFYWTRFFWKQCTVRLYTTPIYLINLFWKLGLGLGLDSELHYILAFLTENKENEHLFFRECHGR